MSETVASRARLAELVRHLSEAQRAIESGHAEELKLALAQFWHENCEWFPLISGVEGRSSYVGHEGILQFMDDLNHAFEVEYGDMNVKEMGDVIVALTQMHLRGRGSGVEIRTELGLVYEIDGERVRRGRAYDSHGAALAAAEGTNAQA